MKGAMLKKSVPLLILLCLAVYAVYYFKNHDQTKTGVGFESPTPVFLSSTSTSPSPSPTETPEYKLPKAAAKLEPKDQRKLAVLQQILASHNDNDPRMDTDLASLNPAVKKAMVAYYAEILPEKRNDRGTIVFLIGRTINSKADVDFLKSVLLEKPCLSLQDCSVSAAAESGEAEHLQGINETTANYPQLNAVRAMIGQYRDFMGETPPNRELAESLIATLREATRSPNPKVSLEAENALRYLKR